MPPRPRGFTLIEIMVVVVIIGILSAAAVPSMVDSYRRATLRTEVDQLIHTLRYAQRMAVVKGRSLRVVIVVDDVEADGRSTYRLELASEDLDQPEPYVKANGGAVKPVTLPAELRFRDVTIDAGEYVLSAANSGLSYALRFFADGSADAVLLQLGDGVSTQTIWVEASTGHVGRLSEDQPPPPPREDLDA